MLKTRLPTEAESYATTPSYILRLPGFAFDSQLVRAAQLAHDVLGGMPLATSHVFIVPFSPTSGHRTLELVGLI